MIFTLLLTSCMQSVERLHYGVKYNTCSSSLKMDDLTIVYGSFNTCGACCDISDFPATPMVKSFQKDDSETSDPNTQFVVPIGTSSVDRVWQGGRNLE